MANDRAQDARRKPTMLIPDLVLESEYLGLLTTQRFNMGTDPAIQGYSVVGILGECEGCEFWASTWSFEPGWNPGPPILLGRTSFHRDGIGSSTIRTSNGPWKMMMNKQGSSPAV